MAHLFWFRRDLRLHDNAGLYHALRSGNPVLPIFIFDTNILEQLDDRSDRRVNFIYQAVLRLKTQLESMGSSLLILHGKPQELLPEIARKHEAKAVFTNHDYEPYAHERDENIRQKLQLQAVDFHTFKDQVIFEKNELLSGKGTPYTVFTPYSNTWKKTLTDFYTKAYPTEKYFDNFLKTNPLPLISLSDMNFVETNENFGQDLNLSEKLLANYGETRDIPSQKGTSRVSVHLRFGTVSIRELVRKALQINAEKWLNELIWRDFYMMILFHFPHAAQKAFKPAYDNIVWRNNEEEFQCWCEGRTGYPIVDAGMRELNATGFMHNRVRMITASFLVKHLLIDWRWGEAYFAEKLLDFELSSNNGGWQWAASSGCDAAPYFRVFNPTLQTQKFDPEGRYIRQWVPELNSFNYPRPIVVHEFARARVLETFKTALG